MNKKVKKEKIDDETIFSMIKKRELENEVLRKLLVNLKERNLKKR